MMHWANKQERGTAFSLRLTAWLVQHMPVRLMSFITYVVVIYFYLTSPRERKAIAEYQSYLSDYLGYSPFNGRSVFAQFLTFAEAIQDRFAVWQGGLSLENVEISDPDHLYAQINHPIIRSTGKERGQILVCSHLGNAEISRALSSYSKNLVLNVLVHSKHAVAFNAALKKAGANQINLIQVTELNMAIMLQLEEKVSRGEWIAIAGDRIPVRGEKTTEIQFLNHTADLPQGPWLMAGLLKTPVNLLFCLKMNGKYYLELMRLTDKVDWQHMEREQSVKIWAQTFADELAKRCSRVPLQWFNFYSFWKK
ncbi:glycosyl transferase family 2 [Pasteurellaceae bacterium LIM206]|nr:glycosyl transferase family 2 [Pasteurellaceae bacterium LIM206]